MSTLKTIKEVGAILHSAPITVYRLVRAGKINYKKIGSRYLFTDEQVQEYLQSVDAKGGKK